MVLIKKLKKFTAGFFVLKNCNLLIPRPPLRTLQEKPSALKREYPALQSMKIPYFFLFLRVIVALLDPDPHFGCGSRSINSN
jgi:hypothetical protein